MTALLLQRTSLQAENELPLESTKLKSESGFWWHFRVACHKRWETLIVAYFSGTYILHFFFCCCSNFVRLSRGPVTQCGIRSHRFMLQILSIYSMTESQSCKAKRVLPKINVLGTRDKQFVQKETWHYSCICLQSRYFLYDHCTKVVPQVTYEHYS